MASAFVSYNNSQFNYFNNNNNNLQKMPNLPHSPNAPLSPTSASSSSSTPSHSQPNSPPMSPTNHMSTAPSNASSNASMTTTLYEQQQQNKTEAAASSSSTTTGPTTLTSAATIATATATASTRPGYQPPAYPVPYKQIDEGLGVYSRTVADLYASLAEGDISSIIEKLDYNVIWRVHGNQAAAGVRKGWHQVIEFFQIEVAAKSNSDLEEYHVKELIEGVQAVTVLGVEKLRDRSSGAVTNKNWVHVWKLNANKQVIAFDSFVDKESFFKATQQM